MPYFNSVESYKIKPYSQHVTTDTDSLFKVEMHRI